MRAAMDTLLVRLTAVEAMVMQKPIISGRYSESPWINLAQPLSELVQQQMSDLVALGKAVRLYCMTVIGSICVRIRACACVQQRHVGTWLAKLLRCRADTKRMLVCDLRCKTLDMSVSNAVFDYAFEVRL